MNPKRTLSVAIAALCTAALLSVCGSSSTASASTRSSTAPLTVKWMPSYAAPGTPARVQQGGSHQGRTD